MATTIVPDNPHIQLCVGFIEYCWAVGHFELWMPQWYKHRSMKYHYESTCAVHGPEKNN